MTHVENVCVMSPTAEASLWWSEIGRRYLVEPMKIGYCVARGGEIAAMFLYCTSALQFCLFMKQIAQNHLAVGLDVIPAHTKWCHRVQFSHCIHFTCTSSGCAQSTAAHFPAVRTFRKQLKITFLYMTACFCVSVVGSTSLQTASAFCNQQI